jgi:hypothetical protein
MAELMVRAQVELVEAVGLRAELMMHPVHDATMPAPEALGTLRPTTRPGASRS